MLFLRIGYTLIKTALNLAGIFYLVTPLSPEGHRYFEHGLPVIELYLEFVYKLMKSFAEEKHIKEAEEEQIEVKALLKEIRILSERAHQQAGSPLNDF